MSFIEARRDDLNDRQLEAVLKTEGPVLVLAGAGSGKTRVLTYRIAHLVHDHGVPLSNILAMTFSNKAAREMQERVKDLLQIDQALPWISTFHSVGARLLRRYGQKIGISSDFVIYDETEQRGMIKDCMEALRISDKDYNPDAVHARIGKWKNEGKSYEEAQNSRAAVFDDVCLSVYEAYTKEMQKAQALDFDDLLLKTYQLFKADEELKAQFRHQWRYVLVDEFQDTNELQYKLLLEFMNEEHNICVVGDDDQSIYGWRGAKIENILNFDKVFKKAEVIKLEQNYRSTATILKAADLVISKNEMRHEKSLWTDKGEGEKIRYAAVTDDRTEASFVVGEIQKKIRAGVSPEEIAVLYRVNSLSRGFEEECLKQRLPYRIIGGFRFYERKEIKDVLSYLKVLLNPADVMAFRRSLNTPTRGIGKTSQEKIEAAASALQRPIALYVLEAENLPVVGKGKAGISQYRNILERGFLGLKTNESFVDLVMEILEKSQYVTNLRNEKTPEASERLENIQELMSAIQEFEENWQPQSDLLPNESPLKRKLADFLERVSLIADVDQLDSKRTGVTDERRQPQVTFMSIHAAKGLEFKVCFLTGLEEGIFPSARSFDDYQQLEEERRLCYVAITRAKDKLYMTRALRRRTFGSINMNLESRFMRELPKELFDITIDKNEEEFDSYGYSYGGVFTRTKSAQKEAVEFDFEFDQRTEHDFNFSKGEKVTHPSFGEGVVQKVELLGSDECLTIQFQRAGRKKVLAKFVKAV